MDKNENLSPVSKAHFAKVFLFDMDGTLVDSTAIIERVWTDFANKFNLDVNNVLAMTHGVRAFETIKHFAPDGIDIALETAELTQQEIMDVAGIKEIAGSRALLQALPCERWAIVTSASRELAIRRLIAVGLPIPEILITAEDVQNGKPAPDGYLMAAKLLQVSIEECVVFEDSVAGLKSANSAGMRAIAIGEHIHDTNINHEQWILNYNKFQIEVPQIGTDDIKFWIA